MAGCFRAAVWLLVADIPSVAVLRAVGSVVDDLDVSWRGWLLCRRLGDGVYPLSKGYVKFVCFGSQFSEFELGFVNEMVSNFLGQLTEKDCACEEVRFVLLWVEGQDLLEEVGGAEISQSGEGQK